MNKHTPGPWQAGLTQNDIPTVRSSSGTVCSFDWRDPARRRADANLVAAAPDLLAALQALLPHVPGHLTDNLHGRPWIEQARAAIAKATKGPHELP